MNSSQKIIMLLSLLLKQPNEFLERFNHIVEVQWDKTYRHPYDYPTAKNFDEAIRQIQELVGQPLPSLSDDPGLHEIEALVQEKLDELRENAPFRTTHSADLALARLCYLVSRMVQPNIVVETGVAYGVTSAFILQALKKNGKGTLHSIDLPPLGKQANDFVGALIPKSLKEQWQLHRGSARRLLPKLVNELNPIDLFIHDSLHTYSHMLWEFNTVTPFLSPNGILLSDDIADNSAFHDWTSRNCPTTAVVSRKIGNDRLIGFAVHRKNQSFTQSKAKRAEE